MSTENQKNLFISYIIIQIIAMAIKHALYIFCLLFIIDFMNN